MVRTIKSSNSAPILEGCTVEVNKRDVVVKGPRGTLTRSFKHMPIDLKVNTDKNVVQADVWFGRQQNIAGIKTVLSHITNMMIGVTRGYKYKMRFAYAHFPVGVAVEGKNVEVRNFLGEKYVRRVPILGDCKVSRTETSVQKDELVVEGPDIRDVSQCAALVHGAC
eukprot:Rhum_TRINITY_DN10716_c0_g1::Rhum_TRINITY_DN10716_c0_g1_i1::g.39770::m.39770/K02940/RP-L9e, RPL9; large subunit ribosomal protein L9e